MINDTDMMLLKQALVDQGAKFTDCQWQRAIDQLRKRAIPESWDEFLDATDPPSDEDHAYWDGFLAELNEEKAAMVKAVKAVWSRRNS